VGGVARAISFDLKVSPAPRWNCAVRAVLNLAYMRKVPAFDSRPYFGALLAPVALPVAAWAKDGLGGALSVVGPIAVLSLAPLAGVFLESLRDGLLIVARYAHSYCNHPIELRGVPHLNSTKNVGFVQLIRHARRRHSSRNCRNWLALAGTANDFPAQLWIVDFESMLLRKLRAELLEFVEANNRQCSPFLCAQLERGQNGSLILRLPDVNALATIREADVAWIGA
jgi:hypothetical protein